MASVRRNSPKGRETTWSVLYRHGGKQTSKTLSTEKAAEDFRDLVNLVGIEKALKLHDGDDGRAQGITVADLSERFLEWKGRDVTERTLRDYRRDITNWIDPWFGHREAEMVDERDVQKWVDHMATKLEPKSVGDRHALLSGMYDFGRKKSRRLVTHNPCDETDLPKRKRKPPKGTTVAEFQVILTEAERTNREARDLILFLGETGWRWSEAAALDVRDVEDDGRHVWVTVSRVFRIVEGKQVIVEDAAKSYAAFRRIRMFPKTAAMLRRRVVGKGPGDLVFTNSRGNHWNQHTFLDDTWPGIIRRAQLGDRKPTPHWLRHMHVAVCFAAGAGPQEVQRRIGHEKISTTVDVYGGLIGEMRDDSLSAAADIMAGVRNVPVVGEVVQGTVLTIAGELSPLEDGPARSE